MLFKILVTKALRHPGPVRYALPMKRPGSKTKDEYGERYTLLDFESWNYMEFLKGTPCPADSCGTCGKPFANDFDFWAHYTVEDIRYPRLGTCPTRLA